LAGAAAEAEAAAAKENAAKALADDLPAKTDIPAVDATLAQPTTDVTSAATVEKNATVAKAAPRAVRSSAYPVKRRTTVASAILVVTPLLLAYGAMVFAQTSGPQIVGFLHGAAAQKEASKPPEDVAPGTPLLELCEGYAAHHFDSIANSFHAAGMTAGLVSVYVGLAAKHLTPLERVVSVLWHPPQWYLYAWVGHFGLQKDVPAVFTYGLTPKSFFSGEFCSTKWVYTGRVFDSKPSIFWPGGGPVPHQALAAMAAIVFLMIGAITPAGRLWQKEYRAATALKAKAKAH